jgi:hypothetical protein
MQSYHLSSAGRRTSLILLICALLIWGFAIWAFRNSLGAGQPDSPSPLGVLGVNLAQGLTIGQIVPALLMLVLIVATPLVIWNILEEWDARYTVADDGLRFESLGVRVTYPWDGIAAVRSLDDDADDPTDELVLREDYTGQIGNPLLRFLHRQAYGRRRLPIYAGLERRDELLAAIRARAAVTTPAEPAGSAA